MSARVKLYSMQHCPFCDRAKRLLDDKEINHEVIDLTSQPEELEKLRKRTGMRTVPQIFINDELIGGFQELSAMESSGELKKKLEGKP